MYTPASSGRAPPSPCDRPARSEKMGHGRLNPKIHRISAEQFCSIHLLRRLISFFSMAEKANILLHAAYARFMYAFTLLFLPTDAVKRLWQSAPLEIDGEVLTGGKLFSILWAGKDQMPLEYISHIWCNMEETFLSFKRYVREDYIEFLKRSDAIEAGMLFRFLGPVLSKLFSSRDVNLAIMRFMGILYKTCNPQTRWVTGSLRKTKDGKIACKHALIMDKSCSAEFLRVDGDVVFAPLTQYMPVRFGATPFEKLQMLSECQTVFERIDPTCKPRIKAGCFYLGGRKYGTIVKFKQFMQEKGISFRNFSVPDVDVVEIEKNFYCRIRRRTILHDGCAYGAPAWVMQVEYVPRKNKEIKDPLQSLKNELVADTPSTYGTLQPKHESLLSSFSKTVHFTYNTSTRTIFVNDRFLTSGTQASILKEMLISCRDKKKFEFERREFMANPEFVCDKTSTGFDTRLNRVAECIARTVPDVSIVRLGKGRFRLASLSAITLTEL